MDCIFCKIVKGEIDSIKIFENEHVLAFLDVVPQTKGHCLVVPKQHFENIFDIDKAFLQKIAVTAKDISEKIKNNLKADGIRLSQYNGRAAGQEIMHFHLHIIPRYAGDGISKDGIGKAHPKKADVNELEKLAAKINN